MEAGFATRHGRQPSSVEDLAAVPFSMTPCTNFSRARRLTRDAEFQRVKREGNSVRSGHLTLAFLRGAEQGVPARAGFVTSRRVGGAVVRNRTRRRLREIFRRQQHRLPTGLWLVVIGSARAAAMTSAALEDDWLRLAQRASILAP